MSPAPVCPRLQTVSLPLTSSLAFSLRIKLNDLLICRRVFVPSDCFAVSLSSGQADEPSPVLSLAISPNTEALLRGEVLSSSFILTVGALRVDRLGRIREASDSLARTVDDNDSYLCPIGYRGGYVHQPRREPVSQARPVSRPIILSPPRKSPTDAPPPTTVFSRQSSHMVSPTMTASINNAISLPTSSTRPNSIVTENLPLSPRLGRAETRPLPRPSPLEHPSSAPRIVSAMSLSTPAPNPSMMNIPSFDSVVVSAPKVRTLINGEPQMENIARPLNYTPAEKRTYLHAGLPNASVYESKRISLPPTQNSQTMFIRFTTNSNNNRAPQQLIATRGGQTVVLRSTKNLTPVQLPTSLSISVSRPSSITTNSVHSIRPTNIVTPTVAIKLNPVDGTQTSAIVPELGKPLAPPDFHLASQLDASAVSTMRIPQIAQLDGIDDRGLSSKGGSVSGKNARQARKGVSVKKKWMVERENREELRNLISKAKQENCDRLYQRELTTHAESFRLSFSVDNVIKAAATPAAAWGAVLQRVAQLRSQQGLTPLTPRSVDGWTQFGLNHRHVVFLVEQLTNAFTCYRYRFRYHQYRIDRLREMFTPPVPVREGCARAMPCPVSPRNNGIARDPLDFLSCR
ncbi:unnamed protein product, partial [Dibothriocephalus latus]